MGVNNFNLRLHSF